MRVLVLALLVGCAGGTARPVQHTQPAERVQPGEPARTAKQRAQPAPSDELTRTITQLDADFFDAFNRCDLEKVATYLADDLETYHDGAGFQPGRQTLLDGVRQNVCHKARRELVSIQVDELADWGALEVGTHRFCEPTGTKCMVIAQFFHIWKRDGDRWLITRIVSYDHRPLP